MTNSVVPGRLLTLFPERSWNTSLTLPRCIC